MSAQERTLLVPRRGKGLEETKMNGKAPLGRGPGTEQGLVTCFVLQRPAPSALGNGMEGKRDGCLKGLRVHGSEKQGEGLRFDIRSLGRYWRIMRQSFLRVINIRLTLKQHGVEGADVHTVKNPCICSPSALPIAYC